MSFDTEPTGYEKTVLSELQGAWQVLRDEVVEQAGFPGWERALFHIDEAMSWESVRNLQSMHKRLVLVRNLLGPVNTNQRICNQREVDEKQEYNVQLVKTGENAAESFQTAE